MVRSKTAEVAVSAVLRALLCGSEACNRWKDPMPLDTSKLRLPEGSFPGIRDRIITLIRISPSDVTQAYTIGDKQAMMRALTTDDTLVAVWTGQWRSDAFQVPAKLLNSWKKTLLD